MDSVEPLHPYWIEFAVGCLARGNEAACWLALLNGTEWNFDDGLTHILNKVREQCDQFDEAKLRDFLHA